ncbi:tetratricopeptide repeat protein [Fodinicola feengrottensis]|uniref:tetratricopeptide repeat protein n=1 Tax=Fodinicola feengrottensis TaxID=435914 RepID=UPI0031D0CDED
MPIPDDITSADLDPAIRSQLSSLAKESAETVARHLVAAGQLVDTDPAAAYAHAAAARAYGGRIGVVREAVGLAAYFAGNWMTSLAELRSYRRMTGSVEHFATEADCERAMGRPEKAIKMLRAPEVAQLDVDGKAELLIVVAGARRDLGDAEAAVAMLVNEAKSARPGRPSTVRLWYAYADMLLAAGRADEARKWFALASHADEDGETDAAARVLSLDGVEIEEAEFEDDEAEDDEAEDDEAEDDETEDSDDSDGDDSDEDEDPSDDEDERDDEDEGDDGEAVVKVSTKDSEVPEENR